MWTYTGVLALTAQSLLVLFMLAVSVAKLAEWGAREFVRHFTNWSWCAQTLFYALTLPLAVHSSDGRATATVVLRYGFAPLLLVVVDVLVLINVLLARGSRRLDELYDALSPAVIIIGNDVMHAWPVLFALAYAAVYRALLYRELVAVPDAWRRRAAAAGGSATAARVMFWLYQTWLAALALKLLYMLVLLALGTNANRVYDSDIPFGVGVAGFAALALALVGAPLLTLWADAQTRDARDVRDDVFSAAKIHA